MDRSAAPIFDTLVNYHAHGRYRFASPDSVRAASRIREPAPQPARMCSVEDRAANGFRYEEANLAVGGGRESG